MESRILSTIEEAIEDIKAGKLVIVVDDEDRENEGDFITAAGNVTIVGRNSAGADGAAKTLLVTPFFGAMYTGDAIFYPDGRQTQRIGIIPDIYVPESINAIRSNKDPILEKAIEFLGN